MRLWGRRVFAWMLGTGGEGIESRRRRQAEQTNSKQIEAKIGEGSIHGWEGGRSAAPALPSRALPSPVPSRLRTRGIPMRLATATALLGGDGHRDWLSALALHWHRNKLKPRSGEIIPEVQTQSIARPIHCKPFFFFSAGRALRRGNVGSARPSISKCTSNAANVGRPRVPAPRRPSWVHANRCAPAEGRQATFPPPSGSDSAPLARGSGGDTVTHPRPRVGCSSRCRGALTTWRKWRLGAEEEAATVIECAAQCCSA